MRHFWSIWFVLQFTSIAAKDEENYNHNRWKVMENVTHVEYETIAGGTDNCDDDSS